MNFTTDKTTVKFILRQYFCQSTKQEQLHTV